MGNSDGLVRIWDFAKEEWTSKVPLPEGGRVSAIAVTADGKYVAAASRLKLFLWPWMSDKAATEIKGFQRVSALEFTDDGQRLVVACDRYDGGPVVRVWDSCS